MLLEWEEEPEAACPLDTTSNAEIETDLSILHAQMPLTTPRRSPSPKRRRPMQPEEYLDDKLCYNCCDCEKRRPCDQLQPACSRDSFLCQL